MPRSKVLLLFGTRPEIIKLAPVFHELAARHNRFNPVLVFSGQHQELAAKQLKLFNLIPHYNLSVMSANQTPAETCARVMQSFDEILTRETPDMVLVQGDTTTALAGALAAFYRQIPVGHVEAGLRSGCAVSPFPEEMNRRLISQLAKIHFAATPQNQQNLLIEGVAKHQIFVTGNPVVDALRFVLRNYRQSTKIRTILQKTAGFKRILLTTHRRESFGGKMRGNLQALRRFIDKNSDTVLIFPVHLNPVVQSTAKDSLFCSERIFLIKPLDYIDFIYLMKESWLIVSDSGGVQEEAPSLGKPLLVLRENTERPEALASGIAKLAGENPRQLTQLLEENYRDETWIQSVRQIENPFGQGDAAQKIADILMADSSA